MQTCLEHGGHSSCPAVGDFSPLRGADNGQRPETNRDREVAIDHGLVERVRRGDQQSLSELIQRNYRHCLKVALGILRNRDDAEDEVQNAFSKAIERFDQYKGEGPFSSWVARIVANEAYVRLRTERNVHFYHLDESISPSTGAKLELVDQRTLPDDELGRHEVLRIVNTEIRHMPPLLRHVLQLRDVQQLSMSSVAAELQVTVPAAKSRLARARSELKSRLKKHGGRQQHRTLFHESYPRAAVALANGD